MEEKKTEMTAMGCYKSPSVRVIALQVRKMIAASLSGSTEEYGRAGSDQVEGFSEENGQW